MGDWEYVTLRIRFENPGPKLIAAYTSQHSSGDCLTPSNLIFVSNTAHPILYVARGSHGTYNKPGRTVYRRIILIGDLADDHDGGNAEQWETWNNVVVRVEGQPLTSKLPSITNFHSCSSFKPKRAMKSSEGFATLSSLPCYMQ